jgi:hypothetical protein
MTGRGDPPSRLFSSIERHAALERAPKSRVEIEQLLLHELRTTEGCEGAKGIAVVGYDELVE